MRAPGRPFAVSDAWASVRARTAPGLASTFGQRFAIAFETEWEHRRLFLWMPVLAGVGVVLFVAADRDPNLWYSASLAGLFAGFAVLARNRRGLFMCMVAPAAVLAGFTAAGLRSEAVSAPMLDRIRIAHLTGTVEEVDHRRTGSRFVLILDGAADLDPAHRPARVRLTTRRDDPLESGDHIAVTGRLLPPSDAALPDGYSFARDAYFMGIGAVGSVLGSVKPAPVTEPPGWRLRAGMAVDRLRNAMAQRVDGVLGGDTGAIAAAMVTGKRDLLSQDGRDIIREAGIFHIITIAGVQMTLVAGLIFGLVRRGLALSTTLALTYPIKKWAALAAIVGAIGYDILTGSRIGTQRALFMTLIMLGAVLVDRRGFTMRNLALAALLVILFEPEAILGASFQLSFAAVAALVTIYEARERRREGEDRGTSGSGWGAVAWGLTAMRDLLVATVCATAATASFMAADFHELSPYVFVGNPLTLAVIEFFAVPGALLGSLLCPLGLDGPVWHWIGAGIGIVLTAARLIGQAPGATLHLPAFAPWALPFLALAVLSVVIWRTWTFRATAIPLALLGLAGTMLGPRYDLLVASSGDLVAARGADGLLHRAGKANGFVTQQWWAADGDGRDPDAPEPPVQRCDRLACVLPVPGGQTLSLVKDDRAFEEDCGRADIIVSRLFAPASCAAPLVIDRGTLLSGGALGLTLKNGGWLLHPSRTPRTDRPWSRPPALPRASVPKAPPESEPGADPPGDAPQDPAAPPG